MNSPWARAEDRKRNLLAAGATAALYCLGFLLVILVGLLMPSRLSDAQGPLVVDLGLPEGAVNSLPLGLPAAPERPLGMPPSPPSQALPGAQPAAKPGASLAPAESPKPGGAVASEAAAAAPKTGEAAVSAPPQEGGRASSTPVASPGGSAGGSAGAVPSASAQPPTTRSFSSSPGSPIQGSAPGLSAGTGTVTFRGSEMGNALDTTFVAAAGKIGRNLYVPIWLYLPLPARVDDSIYRAIPADAGGYYSAEARKESFRAYYNQAGTAWNLKAKVPFDARALLWLMLQEAGYDPSRAEYKLGANLKRVSIDFVVGPAAPPSQPSLVYVNLVSSSGSKEIDDAVIYGFRQASFFNNTGTSVSGHFSYDFNSAK